MKKQRPSLKNEGRSGGRSRPDRRDAGPADNGGASRANVLYGVSPVLEALRSHPEKIQRLIVADGAKEHRLREISTIARAKNILLERVPRDRLSSLVEPGSNHQGIVAMVAAADYAAAEDILDTIGPDTLFVLLDGVEDPRNLGAILRTAECSGVDGVFVPERRSAGLTEVAAKASAGAIEHIKVAKVANMNRLIEELKKRGVWVVGTSGDATVDHTEWDWNRPTALVMGSEGKGVHRLVAENCDALVKVPMYGKIDSLNVSVAAGVILFEARRQRNAAR